jgi:hypothetical protein
MTIKDYSQAAMPILQSAMIQNLGGVENAQNALLYL